MLTLERIQELYSLARTLRRWQFSKDPRAVRVMESDDDADGCFRLHFQDPNEVRSAVILRNAAPELLAWAEEAWELLIDVRDKIGPYCMNPRDHADSVIDDHAERAARLIGKEDSDD